jgi:hypothetical protein
VVVIMAKKFIFEPRLPNVAVFMTALGLAGCSIDTSGRPVGDSNETQGVVGDCTALSDLETQLIGWDDGTNQFTGWKSEPDQASYFPPPRFATFSRTQYPSDYCNFKSESVKNDDGDCELTSAWQPTCGKDDAADASPGQYALHFRLVSVDESTGKEGFSMWGGTIRYDFLTNGDNRPLDAGEFGTEGSWEGIAFWAKRTPKSQVQADLASSIGRSVFVAVTDKYSTENDVYVVHDENGEPFCKDSTIDSEKCDRFGLGVGFEEEWRFVQVPFARMSQRGYGVPSPGLDTRQLLDISIYMSEGPWDLWLSDIGLYRKATK